MKKRILILGAGNAQIDAIEYCKDHGYEVVGCSYTNTDCGIPHLDYFEQVDIKNYEGVADLARKYQVRAIYSVGSDLAMPTAMKASELLGLPHFVSSEVAEICHSKDKMRIALGSDFEGNAKFVVCDNLEAAVKYCDFPAMMKPVDSQGQRGCFRVDSTEDIKEHFSVSLEYSVEGRVIIEQFIDGPEVSVNAYYQDGKMKFALVSDRYAFEEYPGGIIREHTVPSSFAKGAVRKKTIELAERIAVKLGISNGPCYFQIKLNKGTDPTILELAPRFDGCHMWNLIKCYCGVDLLDACFRHLLDGEEVLTEDIHYSNNEYMLKFMSRKPGSVFRKTEFDVTDADYVCYYYEDGDIVQTVNGYIEKCGYIIKKTGRIID